MRDDKQVRHSFKETMDRIARNLATVGNRPLPNQIIGPRITRPRQLRRGIYETTYGNAAYVKGPRARVAFDLDMAANISIEEVTDTFIREVEDCDCDQADDE